MSSPDLDRLVDVLSRVAERLQGAADQDQTAYAFDPQPDITLAEIVMLLKTLNITASSDQYLHENFPGPLKRHFSPLPK